MRESFPPAEGDHSYTRYDAWRVAFDLVFFVLINTVAMNLVLGIIVNTSGCGESRRSKRRASSAGSRVCHRCLPSVLTMLCRAPHPLLLCDHQRVLCTLS